MDFHELKLMGQRRQIAYMMGAKPLENPENPGMIIPNRVSFGDNVWQLSAGNWPNVLLYDVDYNLLIGAVEFIESLGYMVTIQGNSCQILKSIPASIIEITEETKRDSIFKSVVMFSQDYNKNRIKEQWEG